LNFDIFKTFKYGNIFLFRPVWMIKILSLQAKDSFFYASIKNPARPTEVSRAGNGKNTLFSFAKKQWLNAYTLILVNDLIIS